MFGFFKNRKRVITDRTGQIPYLIRWYVFLKDRKDFSNITSQSFSRDESHYMIVLGTGVHLLLKVDIGNTFLYTMKQQEGLLDPTRVWRGPVPIRFRKADDLHWLELEKDENGNEIPCWSLFR